MKVTASVTYERRVEKPRAASRASSELLTARGFAYHARTLMLFCVPPGGSGQHVGFQPRSQGLSSLPPLVVGRKTLVAAGHVTTKNLGGKKLCWVGGVAEYFVWLMWQTLRISNPLAVAKNYSLYRGSKSNLPMKNDTRFMLSSKYRRFSFTKKFGSRMETFWRLAIVKGHVPDLSETSGSVLWIFEFGGNLFSSLCGFLNVRSISVIRSITRVLWLAFNIQQWEKIYSCCWHKPGTFVSSAWGLCKYIFRQMLTQGSLA